MNAELKELAKQAGELAQAQNIKIATAESCTGGLVAAALTYWPGASAWFEQGVISYSNEAKNKLLGVSEKLLERYGAVSEETAAAMCAGVGGHIALAITG
ncbi:MAG: CinA family protein, partial [Gammaproteobacteria bacterium]